MKQKWQQLSRREQWMLMGGGAVLLLFLIIRLMWWPWVAQIDRLHEDIDTEAELIEWMGPRVDRVPAEAQESAPKSVAQLERSLQAQHLQHYVTNFAVGDQGQVNISLQGVPMPLFMTWLNQQSATGWQVIQATLTPGLKSGVGDVVLILG